MKSYGQYCPMTLALEILGERWTLLIVRDLMLGVCRFNDLARGLPGISRPLLSRRLRQLEGNGIVERRVMDGGRLTQYHLTAAGRELQPIVSALVIWGTRWAFSDPQPVHLDPVLLLWWVRGVVQRDRLPAHRVVVQFDFQGACTLTMWLVLDRADVSVCMQHPGFDVDLLLTADLATLYRVWGRRDTFAGAMRRGLVRLDGPPSLARAFSGWLGWDATTEVLPIQGDPHPPSPELASVGGRRVRRSKVQTARSGA
jgi:DNA-binding HxlR family transcriptional regulator